ncbi:MAG: TetR/AcrR family transcriptional regulator [Frankiaceae bacterium]|nr:TetR/AcrR family transcriptional regulator [Frankiaceae bacterium]
MTSAATELDGRRARRGRNREAVVDALLELFREGELSPSVAAGAERSGVSLRSVFRYFDDLDEMGRIAIARHTEGVQHLFPLPKLGEGARTDRIKRMADHRVTLYEAVAPIVRATMIRAPFQPVIAAGLRDRREFLRGQVEAQFAPEISRVSEADRFALVAALDALTSFETLELWHRDRGLAFTKCASVMRRALDQLLPR